MITAQDIGALAMVDKLTRIWVPEGTARKKISAGLDGSEHEKWCAGYLASREREVAALSAKMGEDYSFMLDEVERKRLAYDGSSYLKFGAQVGKQTCFHYSERLNFWQLFSTEPFPSDDQEPGYKFYGYMGCLSFDNYQDWHGIFRADIAERAPGSLSSRKRREFTECWLGSFRRNLWLCGCDIECGPQERREWMQGLAPEEIEAWELKV